MRSGEMTGRSSVRASDRGLALRAAAVALLCSVGGCVTVRAADRELLADPAMTYGAEGTAGAHEEHVLNNREGSYGAGEATGGGCGCN